MTEKKVTRMKEAGEAILKILTENGIGPLDSIAILEVLKASIIEGMGQRGKKDKA